MHSVTLSTDDFIMPTTSACVLFPVDMLLIDVT